MIDQHAVARPAALKDREPRMSFPIPPVPAPSEPTPPVDPLVFRKTMGLFATGITVVTTRQGATLRGTTVNAFMSLSLDPPLVVVALDKRSRTQAIIAEGSIFAVNLLAADQQALSDRFAGRGEAPSKDFGDIPHTFGTTGVPLLDGTLGYVECRLWQTYDGGDHVMFVGEVVALRRNDEADSESPLLYFKSRYGV